MIVLPPERPDAFATTYRGLRALLLKRAPRVDVGEWHAMAVAGRPELVSHELRSITIYAAIPATVAATDDAIKPNTPWAEAQFQERVSGEPLNPGKTYKDWPWQSAMTQHTEAEAGQFSHTYMERYWPRYANLHDPRPGSQGQFGLRYRLGDLSDVVDLLARSPYTRQAVLPVWFPEDTGATFGGRVPCSLTYHFLRRGNALHCDYSIRSCDFVRHFRDDVYMTMRLTQWVLEQLQEKTGPDPNETIYHRGQMGPWADVKPGMLTMHIGSLHIFEGDIPRLEKEIDSELSKALG